MLRTTRLVRNQ